MIERVCFIVKGRVLVGEGVLTKACRKKPKPRQFFLFNDLLVYGNIIINKKKYNKQHIIPLEEVRIVIVSLWNAFLSFGSYTGPLSRSSFKWTVCQFYTNLTLALIRSWTRKVNSFKLLTVNSNRNIENRAWT